MATGVPAVNQVYDLNLHCPVRRLELGIRYAYDSHIGNENRVSNAAARHPDVRPPGLRVLGKIPDSNGRVIWFTARYVIGLYT